MAKKTIEQAGWELTDELRTWAAREVPGVDIERETPRFHDYWLGNGKLMANWDAVFRNWMRRAPQMGGAMRPREFVVPKAASNAPIQLREHPLFKGFKQG